MSGTDIRWAAFIMLAQSLLAQQQDLTSMSFEDFMNVEVVSVNKSREKLSHSAAAVYVITREDIRRSGATSLPEVLRLAPGIHVARLTGTVWTIGIRGFNNVDSNKLQVLVDGRSIYNPLMSGVLWNEDVGMLDDIERIEIIRGPGATMWGANAVAGVINIITRSAKDTTGGSVSLVGGGFDPLHARVRYGGEAGEKLAWRAWADGAVFGQVALNAGDPQRDQWPSEGGGFRIDAQPGARDAVLVEGEVRNDDSSIQETVIGAAGPHLHTFQGADTVGYLMGRWSHTTRFGHEMELQLSAEDNKFNAGPFTGRVRTFDAAVQDSFHLGARHTLVMGAGMRGDLLETQGTLDFSFRPPSRDYYAEDGFIQDAWDLIPDLLSVSAGVRLERYTAAGWSVEPTARVTWTPGGKQTYWGSFSRAVRTPCHSDYALQIPMMLPGVPVALMLNGSEGFRPEVMNGLEAGARYQIHRRLALDIAAFQHRYGGLAGYTAETGPNGNIPVSVLPGTNVLVVPLTNANAYNGLNQGAEVSAQWEARPGLEIAASYSSLFDSTTLLPGFNPALTVAFPYYYPKHQWQVRPHWDFARSWSADLTVHRDTNFPGGALAASTRVDLRLARRLGEYTEFSVRGENLLRPMTQEMIGNVLYPGGLVRRSVEAGFHWTF